MGIGSVQSVPPIRVYRPTQPAEVRGGHRPDRWYFAPLALAGPVPYSPGYETGLEALDAALDMRDRRSFEATV